MWAVQTAALDRLGDLFGLEMGRVFEVGDDSGYFQDAFGGARALTPGWVMAHSRRRSRSGSVRTGCGWGGGHLGVAVEFFAGAGGSAKV
jgi:hypothetical protein